MNRYNILKEAKQIVSKDIFSQVEAITNQYKPDDVYVTSSTWNTARAETRELLIKVNDLQPQILAAYLHCVAVEDWETALYLYMQHTSKPDHLSLEPALYTAGEIREREASFISNAREWINETTKLLEGAK